MNIRLKIKKARTEAGMSIRAAATAYGCKEAYWHRVESGTVPASTDVLMKMAKAVGLKVSISLD